MVLITDILISPVETEKTVANAGKYTFVVHAESTKPQIASAVKNFYGVDVKNVNVTWLPAKQKLVARGRLVNKRSRTKKATVTLKYGATLDFNAFK